MFIVVQFYFFVHLLDTFIKDLLTLSKSFPSSQGLYWEKSNVFVPARNFDDSFTITKRLWFKMFINFLHCKTWTI